MINGWENQQKATFLAVSLQGPAQQLLGDLPVLSKRNYDLLVAELELRFGIQGQSELFRVQLRNRFRKNNESLPELAQDIKRLISRAYPEAPISLQDTLAKDYFIDALVDSDMRLWIQQSKPQSVAEAVQLAMKLEALKQAEKQRF